MQKTGGKKTPQSGSAVDLNKAQPEEAPNLSQRSMRQKLKEAKPKAPAADTPVSR